MTATPRRRRYLVRVPLRPWPWILRYLGAAVPAVVIAFLIMVPLRGWFRLPVTIDALETRSLTLLFDALRASPAQSSGDRLLWIVGLLAIPLAWVALRAIWLWLEGALLTTYAADAPPAPRAFVRAGFHWLGSFLLIGFLVAAAVLVIAVGSVLLVLLGRMLWAPVSFVLGGIGLVFVFAAILYGELARAAAVVWDDRHAFRAFRHAASVLRRRFLPLLALIIGALIVRGLLFLAQRGFTLTIPLSWWAATLIAQQATQIAISGVGLLRRAGEVGLARQAQSAALREH